MNLDRVTITGADDSVEPERLLELYREFGFVEWGILASSSNTGSPRFPSLPWMEKFRDLIHRCPMESSLHLCGRCVRRLLVGDLDPLVVELARGYERIQLNFHAERNECDPLLMAQCLQKLMNAGPCNNRQFIFQIDGQLGNRHMESLARVSSVDAVPLFDISGGAGILPEKWPKPLSNGDYPYYGYAGGLGPDNLAEQIPLIAAAAGDVRHWIDMESKVRSSDDRQFDLKKVRQCLEIAKAFVKS